MKAQDVDDRVWRSFEAWRAGRPDWIGPSVPAYRCPSCGACALEHCVGNRPYRPGCAWNGRHERGEPSQAEMSKLGVVTWLSSEEDGGPDCGIAIGLGRGRMVVVGEVSRRLWEDAGPEAAALGSDGGWWLTLWGGDGLEHPGEVLAKFVDAEQARGFADLFGEIARLAKTAP